jgi:hypothetical protein
VEISWEADILGKIRSNKRATNAAFLQTAAVNRFKTQLIAKYIANDLLPPVSAS